MADHDSDIEEHELPSVEAVLAGTLALMTGYSQALQAELHPRQRLSMGEKVASHLAMLVEHPQLSLGFRQVLLGLRRRWQAMSACTREAALDCAECLEHARSSAHAADEMRQGCVDCEGPGEPTRINTSDEWSDRRTLHAKHLH